VVLSVNGRTSGVTFAPGQTYTLAGCNLGSGGTAKLNAYAPNYGAMTIPLIVDTWGPSAIVAHIDANFGGVPSVSSVSVQVTPTGAAEIGLGGAFPFNAVEVERVICLPTGKLANLFYGPNIHSYFQGKIACDTEYTTASGSINYRFQNDTLFSLCSSAKMETLYDLYDLSPIWARGFVYAGVWNGQYGGSGSRVDTGGAGVSLSQDHKLRVSIELTGNACTFLYHYGVKVRGPRGVDPYPIPVTNMN
jgi:hypothetical protein